MDVYPCCPNCVPSLQPIVDVKTSRAKPLVIPNELQAALLENSETGQRFEPFTKFRQREYTDHIAWAKREDTKRKRLAKILPMIEKGVGMNDKYRN
ncbi:MAG: YdeI/OmpD-associated family protein [Pseudomonadales bacterium]|jgi:uncharacterized protein YdeI (YjbR/CyaY-like superfamily)|nr:YdeI/OmpD-associated family protein [Pseudomonadales bacterium]MDP7360587.1 YdeI/OmpD-associated family protein [Pseudomonadales bacterium]MDP7594347.1 YdeI/OmpD-associated family protein [Pseudomonadales bacterium]HJN50530.1 YdeI/OmpD-associated family protein [Pseudomonadales bacterium]|tara:strand:+ start:78 stop:365 length:288 start_codon:yes stop_codon:yes gene_type:complete